jgi:hypothetical protein
VSARSRDLQAITETVAPYLTDGQVGQAIEFLLRLASFAPRVARDVEMKRSERTVITD